MWNKTIRSSIPAPRGFTLIELVMTIIILGLSTMILIPFFKAITHSPDPMMRQQSISLGQSMMNEILAKKWDENTPVGGGPVDTGESSRSGSLSATAVGSLGSEVGETRPNYDDVDDYKDLLTETDTFQDQTGTPFNLTGFSRSVAIDYIASNLGTIDKNDLVPPAGTTDTKRIRVTVRTPLDEEFTFVAVSCNL